MSLNRHFKLQHIFKLIKFQPSFLKFLRIMVISRLNQPILCALNSNSFLKRAIIRRIEHILSGESLKQLCWPSFPLMVIVFSNGLFGTRPQLYSWKKLNQATDPFSAYFIIIFLNKYPSAQNENSKTYYLGLVYQFSFKLIFSSSNMFLDKHSRYEIFK
jgi:hypothetical protein